MLNWLPKASEGLRQLRLLNLGFRGGSKRLPRLVHGLRSETMKARIFSVFLIYVFSGTVFGEPSVYLKG